MVRSQFSSKMLSRNISFLLHVLDLCVIGLLCRVFFFLLPLSFMFVTIIFNLCYSLQEGTSNYFKGLMLILCYLIVAASFFVHVDPKSGELLRIYCTDSQQSYIMQNLDESPLLLFLLSFMFHFFDVSTYLSLPHCFSRYAFIFC